jgi:hypothetical protein
MRIKVNYSSAAESNDTSVLRWRIRAPLISLHISICNTPTDAIFWNAECIPQFSHTAAWHYLIIFLTEALFCPFYTCKDAEDAHIKSYLLAWEVNWFSLRGDTPEWICIVCEKSEGAPLKKELFCYTEWVHLWRLGWIWLMYHLQLALRDVAPRKLHICNPVSHKSP